jgi:hemoglobin/transferrin/lactoferrin receptor protein
MIKKILLAILLLFLFSLPEAGALNARRVVPDSLHEYLVKVTDEHDQPLPGVNIFTHDLKTATISDTLGEALLKGLSDREAVHFTYIGHQSLRLTFHEIKKRNGHIKMKHTTGELAEIVVLGRRDDAPDKVPYTLRQIKKEDIAFTESPTAADALRDHAGVFVQKSQMGGGSPVIRGFEANRVLLVVDGVRMNNAIYRSGHLQNAITIDNALLERVEVAFGPGSLMYGSDALGGVVHFRSKDPQLHLGTPADGYRSSSNFYARYASASQEKSVHADVNYGRKNWASLTSLTLTDYDDLRAGANRPDGYEHFGRRSFYVKRVDGQDQVVENGTLNPGAPFPDNSNVQTGTAYSQVDFLQKVKFQPSQHFFSVFNFQFSTGTDVPRYDNLTETMSKDPEDLKWAEWYYGPQKRLLASVKSRFSKPTKYFDRATLIGAFQRIDEDRYKRRLNSDWRSFGLEDVWVWSATADFDKNLSRTGRHQLMYGLDFNYNRVRSKAGRLNIVDQSTGDRVLTRYPSGANRTSTAATYGNYRWNNSDSALVFNAGLRYTYASVFSRFTADSIILWPENYTDPGVSSNLGDLTWAVGMTLNLPEKWQMRALASKAFRSPNLDDFSQIREQNGFVTIPNPSLGPERTYNTELSMLKEFGRGKVALRLGATAYYTWLQDFIVRRNFPLPDGTETLTMDGEILETQAKVNAETAHVFGWSSDATLNIGSKVELASSLSFTKGRITFTGTDGTGTAIDTLVPAAHIPPLYGQTSLTYFGKKFKISAIVRYQGQKLLNDYGVANIVKQNDGTLLVEREGSEDNPELAWYTTDIEGNRNTTGTLAWTTWNLYTSWQLSKNYSLNFAVENITDLHYRPFASGVSGPGRNFVVSLRAGFGG